MNMSFQNQTGNNRKICTTASDYRIIKQCKGWKMKIIYMHTNCNVAIQWEVY